MQNAEFRIDLAARHACEMLPRSGEYIPFHAERGNEEKRALSEGEITFSGRLNSYFDGVCKQSNVKGRIDIHL